METAIIVPVWKRPEITEACFENLAKTGCRVIVGVSEFDMGELCEKYGFEYQFITNKPLGRKKNALLKFALQYEWDQLLEANSDTLFDLDRLEEYLNIPNDHYGVNGIYFVHPETRRAQFYRARVTKIWGAGRVVSRQAVEKAFPLWDNKSNIYLDSQANGALDNAGYKHSVVGGEPLVVDIKSNINLHDYDRFKGKPVDYSALEAKFAELTTIKQPAKL